MDTTNHQHKKLYRVLEGKMIAGVCNGIAKYFDVDVTIVRVLFVIALFFSHGGMVLAYIVLIVLMPVEGGSTSHWQDKWRNKMGYSEQPPAHSETYVYHPRMRRRPGLIGELMQVLFAALIVYLLYTYVPQTQPFFDKIWLLIQQGWAWILEHLNTPIR
jgi:phage shock protein C